MSAAPLTASGTLPTATATTSTRPPPVVSETPNAVFSGMPSRTVPSMSAQPMAAGPSRFSIRWLATTYIPAPANSAAPAVTAPACSNAGSNNSEDTAAIMVPAPKAINPASTVRGRVQCSPIAAPRANGSAVASPYRNAVTIAMSMRERVFGARAATIARAFPVVPGRCSAQQPSLYTFVCLQRMLPGATAQWDRASQ